MRKIGDRMKYESPVGWMVWEVTDIIDDHYKTICVDGGDSSWAVGDIAKWKFTEKGTGDWTFIGNFSKVNKFQELYDLLNQE